MKSKLNLLLYAVFSFTCRLYAMIIVEYQFKDWILKNTVAI